jgi:hypothetical protein
MKDSHNTLRNIASGLNVFSSVIFMAFNGKNCNSAIGNSAAGLILRLAAQLYFISILLTERSRSDKACFFIIVIPVSGEQVFYRVINTLPDKRLTIQNNITTKITDVLPYLNNSCTRMTAAKHLEKDTVDIVTYMLVDKTGLKRNFNTQGTFLP